MQSPLSGLKNRFCLTFSIVKRGSQVYVRLHRPPSTSSERLESPECVTYILGKRMLLRRCCPCACQSSSAVGSSKRVTISFSRYYLVTEPFTGVINCLQSWRRHRSSSSSWHPRRRSLAAASSREVERPRTGQIWLAYQLPMSAAVHLRPSLPKNNSENVWELEAFELQQTSSNFPMNSCSCAIGVAVQCPPRRHFSRSLSPATEHAKLIYTNRCPSDYRKKRPR